MHEIQEVQRIQQRSPRRGPRRGSRSSTPERDRRDRGTSGRRTTTACVPRRIRVGTRSSSCRGRGRRRVCSRRVAVAALVAALVFLLPILRDGETSGPETSESPTPRAREATSPALRSFIELVDAVQIAGDRYAERAADFDAGRIGCGLLTTGYVAADEAYVRVAARFGEFGSDPNPRAESAYERAGSEMADVNRHFDSTACPRP